MRWISTAIAAVGLASHAATAQPTDGGGYIQTNGVDEAVTAEGDFVSQTMTIEAWLRPEVLHPDQPAGIVTYGANNRSSFNFCVEPDGKLTFFVNWNQGQETIVGDETLEMDAWQHVAVTYDGSVARLYINGERDKSAAFNAEILPSGRLARLAIGDDYPGESEYLGARFDEVRVWSIARSESEIQDTMSTPLTGWEPGLLAYYNFDEVAGQVVVDKSRSGFHARLGYNLNPEIRDANRAWSGPTRLRAFRLSSSGGVQVQEITGGVPQQLATINAGVPIDGWSSVDHRHEDLHERDEFPCGDNLDRPYVDAQPFLSGADEVTLDNCASAFYRDRFEMPPAFRRAAVIGAANADDIAVAFMNRRPLSLLLTQQDVNNLGTDRIHTRHHLLGWPTPDVIFEDEVPDLLSPGMNRLGFGVCSDASELEPAGLEYDVIVQYECLADWNIDGRNDTTDFTAFLNDWNPRRPETDINGDGVVNTQDVLLYINVWVFGCPE